MIVNRNITKYLKCLVVYATKYPESIVKAPKYLIGNGIESFEKKLSDIISIVEESLQIRSLLLGKPGKYVFIVREIFSFSLTLLFHPNKTYLELLSLNRSDHSNQLRKPIIEPMLIIISVSKTHDIQQLKENLKNLSIQKNDNVSITVSIDPNIDSTRFLRIKNLADRYTFQLSKDLNFTKTKQYHHSKYVIFLKSDLEIRSNVLLSISKYIQSNKDAAVFFSDCNIKRGNEYIHLYKPGYSPDLLLSNNYFGNLLVAKTVVLKKIKDPFRNFFDNNFYDLSLKLTDDKSKIVRIPHILYSQKDVYNEKTKIYVEETLKRRGVSKFRVYSSEQGNNIEYPPLDNAKVSVIIPTKDKVELLKTTIDSLFKQDYTNFETIIVNNNSIDLKTKKYLEHITSKSNVKVIDYPNKFNISKIFNFAVDKSSGELILLLNNDIESLENTWLRKMVGQIQRKNVGGVGVKLLYPNRKIQHSGVVLGLKNQLDEYGVAGHIFSGLSNSENNYQLSHFFNLQRNWSAVTGACFITRKDLYHKVGGFDENLKVLFSDIDYCLKLGSFGYSIVYDPLITLIHHESASVKIIRGNDLDERKFEIQYFRKKWDVIVDDDPYYNPNLSLIGTQSNFATSIELKSRISNFQRKFPHIFKYCLLLKELGFRNLIIKIQKRFFIKNLIDEYNIDYVNWINNTEKPYLQEIIGQDINFQHQPKVSILVPTHNTKVEWLEKLTATVYSQIYSNWELCIADDGSTESETISYLKNISHNKVKVVFLHTSEGISSATNKALSIATGDYIGLLDHDDELAPHALYEVAALLNKHPEADYIYSDEDKLDFNGKRCDPFFKPDWSPDYFLSSMYTTHFSVVRKTIVNSIGGFRTEFNGSQDYDFILRVSENTQNIFHIPKVLYHWRKTKSSTAYQYSAKNYAHEAAEKAIVESLRRRKIDAVVEQGIRSDLFRVKYGIKKKPLVSIIIPTRNCLKYLKICVSSVLSNTLYKNYEIIIVDNQSDDKNTIRYIYQLAKHPNIRVLSYPKLFNYSKINNFAVKKATGEYIILLNNDIEVLSNDWIETLLEYGQQKNIGAVGLKLVYPNNNIQHCGVVLGICGMAGHPQKYFPDAEAGQLPIFNTKDVTRNWLAVTAACLMIKKSKYLKVGGMDPKFEIAFNDVDFCLRLFENGYRNVYTPYAKHIHNESVSVKNPQENGRDSVTFLKEIGLLNERWGKYLEHDPYYNSNLTLDREDLSIG